MALRQALSSSVVYLSTGLKVVSGNVYVPAAIDPGCASLPTLMNRFGTGYTAAAYVAIVSYFPSSSVLVLAGAVTTGGGAGSAAGTGWAVSTATGMSGTSPHRPSAGGTGRSLDPAGRMS